MEINYKNLSEHQLISLATKNKLNNVKLNAEWHSRYGMSYPYKLDIQNNILNCITQDFVIDDEADRLILGQAEQIREKGRRRNEQ